MKPEDLYKPVAGGAKHAPTRRQYVWGGTFCTALCVASAAFALGWTSTITFGVLAVGSFGLALRSDA